MLTGLGVQGASPVLLLFLSCIIFVTAAAAALQVPAKVSGLFHDSGSYCISRCPNCCHIGIGKQGEHDHDAWLQQHQKNKGYNDPPVLTY